MDYRDFQFVKPKKKLPLSDKLLIVFAALFILYMVAQVVRFFIGL